MRILGFHPADIAVITVYLILMLVIGRRASKTVGNMQDFFLSGRRLGRWLQFFLNFGQMTDSNGAAGTSTAVFSNGAGGVWLTMQTLFITPYYWFMSLWFRRARLVTVADLFQDRFGSRRLAAIYATFSLFVAVMMIGWSSFVSYKIVGVVAVKAPAAYTAAERAQVEAFAEYQDLLQRKRTERLSPEQGARLDALDNRAKRGELSGTISVVNRGEFFVGYAAVVGCYTIMGGLTAAALTDAVQGLLIIAFSFILIPLGLHRLGGFGGLHARVPAIRFELFGNSSLSEFSLASVIAILFVSTIQINATMTNMGVSGSARDEFSARLGAVTGGYMKRLMIIAWSLCGFIAYGLFRDHPVDPDAVWGLLSRTLLGPGLLGLMIAGILAGNMSAKSALSLSVSALFVRNVYEPLRAGRSPAHYLLVSRCTVAAALAGGVMVALLVHGIVSFLELILTLNVSFGAAIMLIFLWRRLTKAAVYVSLVCSIALLIVAPPLIPLFPAVGFNPALTVSTRHEPIQAVYFETIARRDATNPQSGLIGIGRFHIEIWILKRLGVAVESMNASALLAARFGFDGVFPFLLLFLVSFLTRTPSRESLDRFFAKIGTPAVADQRLDAENVAANCAHPELLNGGLLFPRSNWQFRRWTREDGIGFSLCCLMAAAILGVLWLVFNVT